MSIYSLQEKLLMLLVSQLVILVTSGNCIFSRASHNAASFCANARELAVIRKQAGKKRLGVRTMRIPFAIPVIAFGASVLTHSMRRKRKTAGYVSKQRFQE